VRRRLLVALSLSVLLHLLALKVKLQPAGTKKVAEVPVELSVSRQEEQKKAERSTPAKRKKKRKVTLKKKRQKPKRRQPAGKKTAERKEAKTFKRHNFLEEPRKPANRVKTTQAQEGRETFKEKKRQLSLKPHPAESPPQPSKKEPDMRSYILKVVKEIEEKKFYPALARRMGIEGSVKVRLEIRKNGKLAGASIVSSSGSNLLDRASLKLLKRCRFPPLPPDYPGTTFSTEVKISYRLRVE
jgi:protein TonB